MKCLETHRLLLRPFSVEDLDDFHSYCVNPNVGNSGGWKPHESVEESKAVLISCIENNDWAIVYQENNTVIGSISFITDVKRRVDNAHMIGYSLSEDYWSMGIMTEAVKRVLQYAFEEANALLVAVYHFPFNDKSRRVIEKCGFVYEGRLRSAYKMYHGEIYDDLCYSILREEYFLNQIKNS